MVSTGSKYIAGTATIVALVGVTYYAQTMAPSLVSPRPLRVALAYVDAHPQSVLAIGSGTTVGSVIPTGEGASIDQRLAADWLAIQIQTLEAEGINDSVAWSQRSVELVRETMLNQREIDLEIRDCTCDKGFEQASFGYLVRGLGNCHTVNYFVGQLVRHFEPAAEWVVTPASAGHFLVSFPVGLTRVFVDGWSDYPVMSLDAEVDDRVPSWAELTKRQGSTFKGLYSREAYQQARAVLLPDLALGERSKVGSDLSVPAELGRESTAVQAYARARVFDLYGLEAQALERYDLAFELGCVDPEAPVCKLAATWRAKRRRGQDPKVQKILGPLMGGDFLGPVEVISVSLVNPDTLEIRARSRSGGEILFCLVPTVTSKYKPMRRVGGYDLFVTESSDELDNGPIEQGLDALEKRILKHEQPA